MCFLGQMHFQTPIKIVKKKNPQGLSDELVQIEINSSDQITLLIIGSFKTGKRENGSKAPTNKKTNKNKKVTKMKVLID